MGGKPVNESTRNLLVSALHNHLDPEAWILVYIDGGGVCSFTNILTTEPENKHLAIAMLDAMIKSLRDNQPGMMARLDPSSN